MKKKNGLQLMIHRTTVYKYPGIEADKFKNAGIDLPAVTIPIVRMDYNIGNDIKGANSLDKTIRVYNAPKCILDLFPAVLEGLLPYMLKADMIALFPLPIFFSKKSFILDGVERKRFTRYTGAYNPFVNVMVMPYIPESKLNFENAMPRYLGSLAHELGHWIRANNTLKSVKHVYAKEEMKADFISNKIIKGIY